MPHRLQGWPAHHPEPPPWLRKSAASQAGRRSQPLPPQQHLPLTCAPAAPSPHEVSRRVPGPSAPRAAAGPGATRRATSEPAACYDPWPRPGRAAPPRTRGTRAGMGERGGLGARCGAHLPPPPPPSPPPPPPPFSPPPSPPLLLPCRLRRPPTSRRRSWRSSPAGRPRSSLFERVKAGPGVVTTSSNSTRDMCIGRPGPCAPDTAPTLGTRDFGRIFPACPPRKRALGGSGNDAC